MGKLMYSYCLQRPNTAYNVGDLSNRSANVFGTSSPGRHGHGCEWRSQSTLVPHKPNKTHHFAVTVLFSVRNLSILTQQQIHEVACFSSNRLSFLTTATRTARKRLGAARISLRFTRHSEDALFALQTDQLPTREPQEDHRGHR